MRQGKPQPWSREAPGQVGSVSTNQARTYISCGGRGGPQCPFQLGDKQTATQHARNREQSGGYRPLAAALTPHETSDG